MTAAALAPDAIEAEAGDRAVFGRIIAKAEQQGLAALPFGQLVQALAQDESLQGRGYAKAPLDRNPEQERVYAGFARFDCVTFVESVLALSETIAQHKSALDDYAAQLAALRYRSGEPAYCERLHYFSDWIRRNVSAGRIDEVTAAVAGDGVELAFDALPQGLNFLSRHAATNPALSHSESRRACVRRSEEVLSLSLARAPDGAPGFAYIPKARLGEVLDRLQGGDILAWVANEPGLDVIHVGIVLRRGGAAAGFAHASSRSGAVAIAPELLAYAQRLPGQRGLIVLRPRAPVP